MDYIELLQSINYFSFITAFIKWVLIFLVLSIIVLVLCHKLSLFKRRTKLAKILSMLYYVFIPIYFMAFAIQFAPIRNSQKEFNRIIDDKKEVVTEFTYNFLSSVVSDSILTQNKSTEDIVAGYLNSYIYNNDSIPDAKNIKFGKKFFMKIKRKVEFSFLKRLIESELVEKASGMIGIDESTGKALYRADFNDLFKEGEIVEIFKMELNKIVRGFYKYLFLMFCIGLLVPAVEITLAKIIKY